MPPYTLHDAFPSSNYVYSSATAGPASPRSPPGSEDGIVISLTSNTSTDKRTFTILPGQPIVIGRSSRSDLKNLQAGPDNALFDCPVVSRRHAELKLSPWEPASQCISITDCSSLHGTTVNGRKLNPGYNFALAPGDVIKLGDRVTRGDDIHDGVSLTYQVIHNPALPPRPITAGVGFSVPSDDEASDIDSDDDKRSTPSMYDEPTSTNTTPEQYRLKLGSQQQPINLEAIPLKRTQIIDLDHDDEDEAPQATTSLAAAPPRVIPDSYEIEVVPESVYGQDTEPLVLDDGEDLTSSEDESDHEPEYRPYTRSPLQPDEESLFDSSELHGDNERTSGRAPQGFGSNIHDEAVSEAGSVVAETSWMADRPASPELSGDSRANFLPPPVTENASATAKPRYDPVRNSQPPQESVPSCLGPVSSQTSQWLLNNPLSMPFATNYGAAPMQNHPWNSMMMVPTAYSPSQVYNSVSAISQSHPLPAQDVYDFNPMVTRNSSAVNQGMSGTEQPSQGLEIPTSNTFVSEASIPKKKISITDIVDQPNPTSEEVQPTASAFDQAEAKVEAQYTVASAAAAAATISSSKAKRKANEVEDEETFVVLEPSAKKMKQAPVTVATPRRKALRRSTKHSITRRVTSTALHVATGAIMGMGAMVVFLNSDKAQQLIDWLG